MEDLRGMAIFARVVDAGSFAAAARQLNLTRAAVSHQIRQLEARLDSRLLYRSTRRLSLTEPGRSYYESCRIILDEAAAAEQRLNSLKDEPVGKIAVACSTNFGLRRLVPLLSRFRQQFPAIEFSVDLSDEFVDLVAGGYDIALRSGPLPDSDLMARKLCSTARLICASPGYLEKRGTPETPSDLAAHDWVTYSRRSGLTTLTRNGREYRIRMSGAVHTNNAAARRQFVLDGHGLGLLPEHEFDDLPDGTLVRLLQAYEPPALDLFAVYQPGGASTMKIRRLLDFMTDELGTRTARP